MIPLQLFDPASSTYTYILHDPATRDALIIDPVDEQLDRDLAVLQSHHLTLRWAVETHAHADHLSAAHWLKTTHYPQARLAIGEGIRTVQKTFRPIFNLGEHFPIDGSQFDQLFADDETFAIAAMPARVIAVPDGRNRWAMREIVVLHELAHHVTRMHNGGVAAHGPEFVSEFIDLMSAVMAPQVALAMRMICDIEGVKWRCKVG